MIFGRKPSIDASDTIKRESIAGDLSTQSPKAWISVAAAAITMQNTGAGTTNICIGCGGCEERCPFDVGVIERMERAAALFA